MMMLGREVTTPWDILIGGREDFDEVLPSDYVSVTKSICNSVRAKSFFRKGESVVPCGMGGGGVRPGRRDFGCRTGVRFLVLWTCRGEDALGHYLHPHQTTVWHFNGKINVECDLQTHLNFKQIKWYNSLLCLCCDPHLPVVKTGTLFCYQSCTKMRVQSTSWLCMRTVTVF